MKVKLVQLHHPYNTEQIINTPVVLAMGFFDGVHLGHQEVIKTAYKIAQRKGIKLAVLTYINHPIMTFDHTIKGNFKYLTNYSQKLSLLNKLHVDIVYAVNFTSSLGRLSPQEFVNKYMIGLHAVDVVAGYDHTYGKRDKATMDLLTNYSHGKFAIHTVKPIKQNGLKISSSNIRKLIDNGNVALAAKLLGHHYQNSGFIVHGNQIGRKLGFPTANINIPYDQRIPKQGVYSSWLKINDQWYLGMTSIGTNDTVQSNGKVTIETHLLDFTNEVYGEYVNIAWGCFLRENQKFKNPEALVQQLKKDLQTTRDFGSKHKIIDL